MKINYDKLVKEWSDRMSGRAPIYTNRYHRTVLRDVMKDFGYSLEYFIFKKNYSFINIIGSILSKFN